MEILSENFQTLWDSWIYSLSPKDFAENACIACHVSLLLSGFRAADDDKSLKQWGSSALQRVEYFVSLRGAEIRTRISYVKESRTSLVIHCCLINNDSQVLEKLFSVSFKRSSSQQNEIDAKLRNEVYGRLTLPLLNALMKYASGCDIWTFLTIPVEMKVKILSLLNANDLCNLMTSCRLFHALGRNDLFWKPLYEAKYGICSFDNDFYDKYCRQTSQDAIFAKRLKRIHTGSRPNVPHHPWSPFSILKPPKPFFPPVFPFPDNLGDIGSLHPRPRNIMPKLNFYNKTPFNYFHCSF